MNIIIFSIIISVLQTLLFNLISVKKINILSVFAYIIDVLIVSSTFYVFINKINRFIEQPLTFLLSLLVFIILLLAYFSFFRKILYFSFSKNKQNIISIEKYILDNYNFKLKVSKSSYTNNIIFIPIINKVLLSQELVNSLSTEDLANSIFLETRLSFGNFLYIFNYLIPLVIFYYGSTSDSQNIKTILILTGAASIVILKKVTSFFVFKTGLKALKGKVNKHKLIKSYTNYTGFLQENRSKIESIKQNLLLKNKIAMIEKAL